MICPSLDGEFNFLQEYAEVGRGLLVASLDLFELNPLPRVAPNQVKALRAQIYRQVVNQRQGSQGKVKITSRSTATHVINNDRLTVKKSVSSQSQPITRRESKSSKSIIK